MARARRRPAGGGIRRLVYLLERYGEAIERDLFDRRWKLSTLWRQREWRLLLNVVDHLPRDSAYGEALAMDELLVDPESAKAAPPRPSMREWSPEVELLAAIFDRLNGVIQIQSEKKLNLKPWPGPMTAAELVKQRQRQKNRARLRQRVAEAQQRYAAGHPMTPAARGFYQDHSGRWHRADGRFVSWSTVRAATTDS